jgi:hypothetical protein
MQSHVPSATRQSDTGKSNTSNIQCDLCSNPYPYMCSECCGMFASEEDIAEDTAMFEQKMFIGSGEDVCL